ncbi:MAG: tol-pal system protein YbgF [Leptothrix sp. (in: b-proteobacteria)]
MNAPGKSGPTSRHNLTAAVLLAVAGWSAPAQAALFSDDEARKAILDQRARIDQIVQAQAAQQSTQSRLEELQKQLSDQLDQVRRGMLDLNNQIELVRSEMAKLRGQDEQAGFQAKSVARDMADSQRRLTDQIAALEERLRKLEPQKVTIDGREVQVDPEEQRSYNASMATLRQGDFSAAASALQAFLRRYPDSAYRGQVQYWLGNALYGKGDVKEALAVFRELVSNSPQHPQVPEAMLAIANCQIELKDVKAARKTVDDLVKAYPNTEAARAGRERVAKLK